MCLIMEIQWALPWPPFCDQCNVWSFRIRLSQGNTPYIEWPSFSGPTGINTSFIPSTHQNLTVYILHQSGNIFPLDFECGSHSEQVDGLSGWAFLSSISHSNPPSHFLCLNTHHHSPVFFFLQGLILFVNIFFLLLFQQRWCFGYPSLFQHLI